MDLHLTPDPHDRGVVRVFVHGVLVAESCAGLTQDRDSLLAEVTAARALHAIAREIRTWAQLLLDAPTARDHAEMAHGRDDGLCNALARVPSPGVPLRPPEHGVRYRQGYAQGQALRRCLEVLAQAEEAPHG
jgi:hypothetical protein